MIEEIFKDIPNYEGLYQVSNLGRVKTLSRVIKRSNNAGNFISKEKILKQHFVKSNDKSYYAVSLFNNIKMIKFRVHQLVAIAFLGHKPNGFKIVVDHINNNWLDNRLDNLQLISHRYNCSKDKKGGTSKYVGVHWEKTNKKWRASIRIDYKWIHIGRFNTEIEAHNAYQQKLTEIKK